MNVHNMSKLKISQVKQKNIKYYKKRKIQLKQEFNKKKLKIKLPNRNLI